MNLSKLVKLMLCVALFGASASQAADKYKRRTAAQSSRSRVPSRKDTGSSKKVTTPVADKTTLEQLRALKKQFEAFQVQAKKRNAAGEVAVVRQEVMPDRADQAVRLAANAGLSLALRSAESNWVKGGKHAGQVALLAWGLNKKKEMIVASAFTAKEIEAINAKIDKLQIKDANKTTYKQLLQARKFDEFLDTLESLGLAFCGADITEAQKVTNAQVIEEIVKMARSRYGKLTERGQSELLNTGLFASLVQELIGQLASSQRDVLLTKGGMAWLVGSAVAKGLLTFNWTLGDKLDINPGNWFTGLARKPGEWFNSLREAGTSVGGFIGKLTSAI